MTAMTRPRSVLLALAVLVTCGSTTACQASDETSPRRPTGFGQKAGTTRVFDLRDHQETGADQDYPVTMPRGTRTIAFHVYCRHRGGSMQVTVSGVGGGGIACSKRGASGHVYEGTDGVAPFATSSRARVRVRAPQGAVWSVAVDSLPKELASAG